MRTRDAFMVMAPAPNVRSLLPVKVMSAFHACVPVVVSVLAAPLVLSMVSLPEANTPLGSRIPSAVFGTATVILIALTALLLFESVLWCYVAGVLAASEALLVVQSRVTLLDIFVAFWVVLGFMFVVLDRRFIAKRTQPPHEPVRGTASLSMGPGAMTRSEPTTHAVPGPGGEKPEPRPGPQVRPIRHRVPSPLWRPWRFGAGLAFGAAVATKWFPWPTGCRRASIWSSRRRTGIRRVMAVSPRGIPGGNRANCPSWAASRRSSGPITACKAHWVPRSRRAWR